MSEILVAHGQTRKELAKIFGVSGETVKSALKFRTDSALARKIRKSAKEKGGVEI
jgi:transposase